MYATLATPSSHPLGATFYSGFEQYLRHDRPTWTSNRQCDYLAEKSVGAQPHRKFFEIKAVLTIRPELGAPRSETGQPHR
ncbi:MAG: hypothetical protein ACTSWM_09525, partial [Alphaproteobacteria bacterium]